MRGVELRWRARIVADFRRQLRDLVAQADRAMLGPLLLAELEVTVDRRLAAYALEAAEAVRHDHRNCTRRAVNVYMEQLVQRPFRVLRRAILAQAGSALDAAIAVPDLAANDNSGRADLRRAAALSLSAAP